MTGPQVLQAPSPAMLLKLAHDDAQVMISTQLQIMHTDMLAWEDRRSRLRNRNRLVVLVTSLIISTCYPLAMLRIFHATAAGAYWTAALSACGDILVTTWAYLRRY
jgi:hypothetical protein